MQDYFSHDLTPQDVFESLNGKSPDKATQIFENEDIAREAYEWANSPDVEEAARKIARLLAGEIDSAYIGTAYAFTSGDKVIVLDNGTEDTLTRDEFRTWGLGYVS